MKLDDLDRRIIRVLQDDATLSPNEVAARVGASESTVRRRIARASSVGAMRIVAVASPFDLGFEAMVIIGVKLDRALLETAGEALVSHDRIRFAGVTLGVFDVVAEAWLEDGSAVVDFISEIHAIAGVQTVEVLQVLKLLKYTYDWGRDGGTR